MISRLSIALILSLSTTMAFAAEPQLTSSTTELNQTSCLSQQTVTDIAADFKIYTELEKKVDNCDPEQFHNKFFRGMAFIKYGKFQANPQNDDTFFDSSISSDMNPYDRVQSRVKKINIVKSCAELGNGTVAYASIFKDPDTISLCADFAQTSVSMMAEAIVHETRHLDDDGHPHVSCIQGNKMGSLGACDQSIKDKGAYFYGLQYTAAVGKYGANFHPAIKNYFRALAVQSVVNDFNEIPQAKKDKIVVLKNAQGELLSLDVQGKMQSLNQTMTANLFDRRDGSFTVYDAKAQQMMAYNPYSGITAAIGTTATQYNQSSDKKEIVSMRYQNDVHEAFGLLTNNDVEYDFTNSLDHEYDQTLALPFKDAQRFLKPSMCPAGQAKNLYIKTTEDRVFEVSMDNHEEVNFNEIQGCVTDLLNTATLGSTEIALGESGILMQKSGDAWTPIDAFKDQRFTFMSESLDLFDFFKQSTH